MYGKVYDRDMQYFYKTKQKKKLKNNLKNRKIKKMVMRYGHCVFLGRKKSLDIDILCSNNKKVRVLVLCF